MNEAYPRNFDYFCVVRVLKRQQRISPAASIKPKAGNDMAECACPGSSRPGVVDGYTVEVSVTGPVTTRRKAPDSTGMASFPGLPAGEYLITVIVRTGPAELARATKNTVVGQETKDETINITLPSSQLNVGVLYGINYAAVNGEYRGQARTSPYCFENDFLAGFGIATAETTLAMSGGNISIRIEIFSGLVIEFTGTYTDASGAIEATGTYRSSDFKEGTWVLESIAEPQLGSLFLSVQTAGACETVVDVVGLKM